MIIWYLNGTPQICRGLLRQDLHSTCVLLCTRIQIDFQMSSGCAIWRPGWWPCRGRWPWPSQTRQLLRKNRYRRYPSTVRRFFKSLFFSKPNWSYFCIVHVSFVGTRGFFVGASAGLGLKPMATSWLPSQWFWGYLGPSQFSIWVVSFRLDIAR